jgi:FHA domain
MSGNDGFIETPSWLTPVSPAVPETDHTAVAADDTSQDEAEEIILPPGIADSATFRLPAERLRTPPAKPEVVFFPAQPGVVSITPSAPEPELTDATVHVIRPNRAWRLVFPGSPPVVVGEILFVGRNPSPTPGHDGAPVLSVSDSTKSVSKTHAMLELDDGVLWIHDLESTNGVWVVAEGSDPVEVVPGTRSRVPAGADLELGDFIIQVEHS